MKFHLYRRGDGVIITVPQTEDHAAAADLISGVVGEALRDLLFAQLSVLDQLSCGGEVVQECIDFSVDLVCLFNTGMPSDVIKESLVLSIKKATGNNHDNLSVLKFVEDVFE